MLPHSVATIEPRRATTMLLPIPIAIAGLKSKTKNSFLSFFNQKIKTKLMKRNNKNSFQYIILKKNRRQATKNRKKTNNKMTIKPTFKN